MGEGGIVALLPALYFRWTGDLPCAARGISPALLLSYSLESRVQRSIGIGKARRWSRHSSPDNTMKINGANGRTDQTEGSSGISPGVQTGQGGKAAQPESASVSVASDQVELSSLAQLAQLASSPADSPGHASRLSSLSATVSTGSYGVDPGVLSNSIIEASTRLSAGY